jgi:hypothetical protein
MGLFAISFFMMDAVGLDATLAGRAGLITALGCVASTIAFLTVVDGFFILNIVLP